MTVDRVSPLAGWTLTAPGLQVTELPFVTQLNLRLRPAATTQVLGVPLPTTPCTSAQADDVELLWLGPDEWLLLAPPDAAVEAELRTAVGGQGAVTDVSAHRTAVSLTGEHAREVLAKSCSIDFHPRVAAAGYCVQTLLAQTGVIIVHRSSEDFLLLVRSSYAQYLSAWLTDAAGDLTG